ERDARAAEAVGLDRIGAGAQMRQMDVAHHIGPGLAQDVGDVLMAVEVALDIERARLHLGPHRAIAEKDALGEEVKDMRHDQTAWQATAAVAARTPIMWQM